MFYDPFIGFAAKSSFIVLCQQANAIDATVTLWRVS